MRRPNAWQYRPLRPVSAARQGEKRRAFDAGCVAGATGAVDQMPRRYLKDSMLAQMWRRGYAQGRALAEEDGEVCRG